MKLYLSSLKRYILISVFIFLFAIFSGYSFAQENPVEAQEFLSLLKELYGPVFEMSKLAQFLFILLKNGLTSFIMIISGLVFGIVPLLAVFSNGEALGTIANLVLKEQGSSFLLLGVLPHGLLELPALFISSAMGLKIGVILVKKVLKKEKTNLLKELEISLSVFLKVVFPLLFFAALIEVFITPMLM